MWFQKISIPTSRRVTGNSKGEGCSNDKIFLKEIILETNWNFHRGWGLKPKNPMREGYGYFLEKHNGKKYCWGKQGTKKTIVKCWQWKWLKHVWAIRFQSFYMPCFTCIFTQLVQVNTAMKLPFEVRVHSHFETDMKSSLSVFFNINRAEVFRFWLSSAKLQRSKWVSYYENNKSNTCAKTQTPSRKHLRVN